MAVHLINIYNAKRRHLVQTQVHQLVQYQIHVPKILLLQELLSEPGLWISLPMMWNESNPISEKPHSIYLL
jgi:hypothetical protein